MASVASESIVFPVDTALSERSRKFYDGTYQWDSEGFTDDSGVYRTYDCYDPDARAPTPLPPMLLDDEEIDRAIGKETAINTHEPCSTVDIKVALVGPAPPVSDGTLPQHVSETCADSQKPAVTFNVFTFAAEDGQGGTVAVKQDDLFLGRPHREHFISKMEGIIATTRQYSLNLTLEQCYRLCGDADVTIGTGKAHNRELTPPESPVKSGLNLVGSDIESKALQDSNAEEHVINSSRSTLKGPTISPVSDLSDCPSSISDWDVADQVRARGDTPTPTMPKYSTKDQAQDEAEASKKPTRRGVAQKVDRKTPKKMSSMQSNGTPAALLSLQSGSFMRAAPSTTRRRSSRQANAKSTK